MHRFAILLMLVSAAACSGSTLDSALAAHRDETGLAYRDCGTVARVGSSCATALSAAELCVRDAFASCTPAEVAIEQSTVEGDPVPEHWFVERGAAGACQIVRYSDSSADAFKGDYADLERHACAALTETTAPCALLAPTTCVLTGEW